MSPRTVLMYCIPIETPFVSTSIVTQAGSPWLASAYFTVTRCVWRSCEKRVPDTAIGVAMFAAPAASGSASNRYAKDDFFISRFLSCMRRHSSVNHRRKPSLGVLPAL